MLFLFSDQIQPRRGLLITRGAHLLNARKTLPSCLTPANAPSSGKHTQKEKQVSSRRMQLDRSLTTYKKKTQHKKFTELNLTTLWHPNIQRTNICRRFRKKREWSVCCSDIIETKKLEGLTISQAEIWAIQLGLSNLKKMIDINNIKGNNKTCFNCNWLPWGVGHPQTSGKKLDTKEILA